MAKYFLALDGGTGSVRAVVFSEKGTVVASSSKEWVHLERKEYPGSMEFDSEKNWGLTTACIKDILQTVRAEDIAAVSCTSMREAIVVFDRTGKELWACANVDARSVDQVRELRSSDENLELELYKKSGQTFALGAAPRLLWLKQYEPQLFDQIHSVAMVSDWFAVRLGAPISIDPSNGGTTGLFALDDRSWSEELIVSCGLSPDMFHAQVAECGTAIGTVSQKVAKETGLLAGTTIAMGGGDAQLGSIGVGAVAPGDVALFGGSFWQQEVCIPKPVADPEGKLRINFHAVPGKWQIETIAFMVGLAVRWYRDAICPDLVQKAKETNTDAYILLDEMAKQVPPGSHGIIPIFSDSMDYLNWRHAAPSFLNLGFDPKIYSRGALFRALMENAAIVAKTNIDEITNLTKEKPNHIFFAGGAAKSSLWRSIVADVLQLPIIIPKVEEATALGAAMCAAVGSGYFADFEEAAKEWVSYQETVLPNPANRLVYEKATEQWKAAYKPQLELADQGITTHMWKAPGA